jgi:hypothetical protein
LGGEVSGDGWNWSIAARAADTIEKTEPINYAGRGLNYDYEGTNRNITVGYASVAERQAANPVNPSDPNLLPGTADVSAPDGPEGEDAGTGYLWDAALRSGLTVRNYGFFIDLTRYSIPVNIGGIDERLAIRSHPERRSLFQRRPLYNLSLTNSSAAMTTSSRTFIASKNGIANSTSTKKAAICRISNSFA